MSKKYVMKKTVIKALREEPLSAGNFVSDQGDPNCPVCAVGAVLRHAGLNNKEISEFGDDLSDNGPITAFYLYSEDGSHNGTLKSLLADKKYLNALSVRFEDQVNKTGSGNRTRELVIKFVEKNFPNRIPLTSG